MNEKDKYLIKIGEEIVRNAETKGFACDIIRPWNDSFEISFLKGGDFSLNYQEIRSILARMGFGYTTQILSKKIELLPHYEYLYANFYADIGCLIERNRHYIQLFSNLRKTYE